LGLQSTYVTGYAKFHFWQTFGKGGTGIMKQKKLMLVLALMVVFVAGILVLLRPGMAGEPEKGVSSPNPRFTDNSDGTVTDNLTGLIWLKNADCAGGRVDWNTAVDYAAALYDGCSACFGGSTDCGLSDGSVARNWRLPNQEELQSLIDYGKENAGLPDGHPFTGVQSDYYWSSTTHASNPNDPCVHMSNGHVDFRYKTDLQYVWPMRKGN
jgi:hypothetical protein